MFLPSTHIVEFGKASFLRLTENKPKHIAIEIDVKQLHIGPI